MGWWSLIGESKKEDLRSHCQKKPPKKKTCFPGKYPIVYVFFFFFCQLDYRFYESLLLDMYVCHFMSSRFYRKVESKDG